MRGYFKKNLYYTTKYPPRTIYEKFLYFILLDYSYDKVMARRVSTILKKQLKKVWNPEKEGIHELLLTLPLRYVKVDYSGALLSAVKQVTGIKYEAFLYDGVKVTKGRGTIEAKVTVLEKIYLDITIIKVNKATSYNQLRLLRKAFKGASIPYHFKYSTLPNTITDNLSKKECKIEIEKYTD